MYLHEDFIACIKDRFAYAHPGNVNMLLEYLNKLARAGVVFKIETDYIANRELLICTYKGQVDDIELPYVYTDNSCVRLCSFLSTVRDNLGVLVS